MLIVNDGSTGTSEFVNCKIHDDDPSYCRLAYNTHFPWEANSKTGTTAAEILLQPFESDDEPELPFIVNSAGYHNDVLYRQVIFEKGSRGGSPCFVDMADIIIPGGKICVRRWRKVSPANLVQTHFGLPHLKGLPTISRKTVGGKETLVLAGEGRQLAITHYSGWQQLETAEHVGLHPEADKSTVPYSSCEDRHQYGAPELLISIMLQRTDDVPWTDGQLQPIRSVQTTGPKATESLGPIRITLKTGTEYVVDFRGIDGSSSH